MELRMREKITLRKNLNADALFSLVRSAIPVMAVNAYKRRFDISFLRKHFIILRASIRHIIMKINYKWRYYSRVLGLKQNKRPGIAANTSDAFKVTGFI